MSENLVIENVSRRSWEKGSVVQQKQFSAENKRAETIKSYSRIVELSPVWIRWLVSKETTVLRRWEGTNVFGFSINRVDN